MPEPTNPCTTPFHRRPSLEQNLLDDLYYILDSSMTNLERMSVNMCIDKVKKYLASSHIPG